MKKERLECKRDGLTIRGYIYGKAAAPKPAVILSHGFLANMTMCRKYAELLANLGYVAVIYDFCGGGLNCKSDGKSEDMTILTEKSDLLALFDYLKRQPYIIPERISLLGCSQGGVVSALAAREIHPEKLILCYPAVCIPDDARKGKMMFYKFDPQNIPDLLGKFPMRLGGDYARIVINMDIYKEITGYEGPTLYLHGTKDSIVDISYARKAKTCFPQCEYHEIIGGGHMFKGHADKEACELISNFMK